MSFPTTPILDTFNRADENPIAAPWVNSIYAADLPLAISSNALVCSGGGWGDAYYGSVFGPDCEIYFTIDTDDFSSGLELAVKIVNGDTAVPDFYMVHINGGAGTWQIWKSVTGIQTNIGGTVAAAPVVSGDSIGLSVTGDLIEAWHKPAAGSWTLMLSQTDSTFSGVSGDIGVLINQATWRLDGFGGGTTIVAGGEPPTPVPPIFHGRGAA